jgi:cytohesin
MGNVGLLRKLQDQGIDLTQPLGLPAGEEEKLHIPGLVRKGTLLHWAATGTSSEMVQFLIGLGIGVNAQDGKGATPLQWAASEGSEAMIEDLLQRGGDVHQRDQDDITPLHWAAASGRLGVVTTLAGRGGNIRAADNSGNLPMQWAMQKDAREGSLAVVTWFLDRGIDPNSCNVKTGESLLHYAAKNGRADVVELLLSRGARVNVVTAKGDSPLHWAAWYGHANIVELLIPKDSSILNRRGDHQQTALHRAVLRNKHRSPGRECVVATVQALLDKGADPTLRDQDRYTPKDLAKLHDMGASVIELFRPPDSSYRPLRQGSEDDQPPLRRRLCGVVR